MKKTYVNSLEPSKQQLNNLLEYYQAGRLDDAEKLSLSITQEFPEHQFAWKVLGATLKQMGKINESLVASQKSVQLKPQDAEAHNNLGVTLQELGRLKEAEASLRQAIALKPDFAKAHNNLGVTLKELGRLDEAEVSYRQAITLKPDYAEAHYNLGIILQELGRLDEAEISYRQTITLKPDYAVAHSNLGVILQELGRLNEAEKSYRKAIRLKPDLTEAHNNLGITLQELGKLDVAEASYRKAIKLKPDYAEAYSNLGNTLKELGRLDEAISSFQTAYQINPNLDIATIFAAAYLRNKDPGNALPLLEQYLKKYPQDARANAYKTIALRGLGEFDQIDELISFQNLVKKIHPHNLIKEDLVAFNKKLRRTLVQDPRRRPEDNLKGWAIRGGTVIRNLLNTENPSILKFETVLRTAIDQYIANLPDNIKHPFLMMKTESYQLLNCWANFLQPGDYQSNHIHNQGSISGVYYLDEPEIEPNEEHAGWIEFNRAGYNLPHFAGEKGIELIKPTGGMFIFFPSYVWHGTIPYTHSYSRISISFDIKLG